MPKYVKVEYSSPSNISVEGADYFEVADSDLDENGNVRQEVIDRIWQEAVNEFMSDTSATVVEKEDED